MKAKLEELVKITNCAICGAEDSFEVTDEGLTCTVCDSVYEEYNDNTE